jgi:sialic acid synthase SpsE
MARVIAECCQNHKGDRSILKDMVWAAADAGADYVKIQSMLSDELTFRERFENGVTENGVTRAIHRPYRTEFDRLKPMDLDDDVHRWFIDECRKAGIRPLTTVFARSRVPFLARLPWDEIKVASYDCGSLPLLRDLMPRFKHLYISTGATHDAEIERTAALLAGHAFSFLHCVTIYPTPLDALNLARMRYLARLAPSVGFSDHSLVSRDGMKASLGALRAGAQVIERHYTILPPDATRDGPVSINPAQLKELGAFARMPMEELDAVVDRQVPEYPVMLGHEQRELTPAELLNRDYYRGRFASRVGDRILYNWEETDASPFEPGR